MKLKETKTKKKYYKLKALFLVLYKQFFIFMMIFITEIFFFTCNLLNEWHRSRLKEESTAYRFRFHFHFLIVIH